MDKIMTCADGAGWSQHLSAIGRNALRGMPVELEPQTLEALHVDAACADFIASIDAVLAAAINDAGRAGLRPVLTLDEAMALYTAATARCVGAALYLAGDAAEEELLEELRAEMHAARDALRTMSGHYEAQPFARAARRADARMAPALSAKYAALSFRYDDRAARAA